MKREEGKKKRGRRRGEEEEGEEEEGKKERMMMIHGKIHTLNMICRYGIHIFHGFLVLCIFSRSCLTVFLSLSLRESSTNKDGPSVLN
jgi:hypothetical protein